MYNAKLPTLHPTFYKLQLFPDCSKFHNLSARLFIHSKKMFCKEKATVFYVLGKGVGEESMLSWSNRVKTTRLEEHSPPMLHTTLFRGDITNYRIQAKLSNEWEQAR